MIDGYSYSYTELKDDLVLLELDKWQYSTSAYENAKNRLEKRYNSEMNFANHP